MADTTKNTTVTVQELRPILEHFAKAAALSQQAWKELEAVIPLVLRICPDFYESTMYLTIGAYQSTQTIEGAADDLLIEQGLLDTHSQRRLSPASQSGV